MHAFHRGEVNHQLAVTGDMAGSTATATADGHGEIMGVGEWPRLSHIGDAGEHRSDSSA